jgi:hypothetical protein
MVFSRHHKTVWTVVLVGAIGAHLLAKWLKIRSGSGALAAALEAGSRYAYLTGVANCL